MNSLDIQQLQVNGSRLSMPPPPSSGSDGPINKNCTLQHPNDVESLAMQQPEDDDSTTSSSSCSCDSILNQVARMVDYEFSSVDKRLPYTDPSNIGRHHPIPQFHLFRVRILLILIILCSAGLAFCFLVPASRQTTYYYYYYNANNTTNYNDQSNATNSNIGHPIPLLPSISPERHPSTISPTILSSLSSPPSVFSKFTP